MACGCDVWCSGATAMVVESWQRWQDRRNRKPHERGPIVWSGSPSQAPLLLLLPWCVLLRLLVSRGGKPPCRPAWRYLRISWAVAGDQPSLSVPDGGSNRLVGTKGKFGKIASHTNGDRSCKMEIPHKPFRRLLLVGASSCRAVGAVGAVCCGCCWWWLMLVLCVLLW